MFSAVAFYNDATVAVICVCFLMICSLLWLFMIYKSSLLLHEHSGPRKFHVCTLRPKMRKIVWQSTCENVTNQDTERYVSCPYLLYKEIGISRATLPYLASPLDLFCLVSSESINPMYTPLLLLCICDRILYYSVCIAIVFPQVCTRV